MTTNPMIEQINCVFQQAKWMNIDWYARVDHLAFAITSGHLKVNQRYDYSPETDDSQLAAEYWALYDVIRRAIVTMMDLRSWDVVRYSLSVGKWDDVDGDIAYAAIQTALRS